MDTIIKCLFVGGRLHNKIRPVKGNIYVVTWEMPGGLVCRQFYARVDGRPVFMLYRPAQEIPYDDPEQGHKVKPVKVREALGDMGFKDAGPVRSMLKRKNVI